MGLEERKKISSRTFFSFPSRQENEAKRWNIRWRDDLLLRERVEWPIYHLYAATSFNGAVSKCPSWMVPQCVRWHSRYCAMSAPTEAELICHLCCRRTTTLPEMRGSNCPGTLTFHQKACDLAYLWATETICCCCFSSVGWLVGWLSLIHIWRCRR